MTDEHLAALRAKLDALGDRAPDVIAYMMREYPAVLDALEAERARAEALEGYAAEWRGVANDAMTARDEARADPGIMRGSPWAQQADADHAELVELREQVARFTKLLLRVRDLPAEGGGRAAADESVRKWDALCRDIAAELKDTP